MEKIEKAKNAQLAREIEIALPRELTREQGISLVREYVKEQFVAAGMCADFAIGEQLDIQHKLKPIDRRLGTLKKHIEQADIYFKYKGKKHLTEAEQILFTAAHDYLKGVMNGKTALPVKAWKAEYAKLTAERETLNRRYLALKGEVKEAEQIRRSVYNILRQEQREQQPRRAQDMER